MSAATGDRPDDALEVGQFHVRCPTCNWVVVLPVYAWLEDRDGATHTMTMADNDPLWEHSLLTHPEAHA